MFAILSLVTSIKDYVEIVHKLVEGNNSNTFEIPTYYDFGAILTYLILTGKEILIGLFSFKWIQSIASLPLIIPDIASAMISEISVLDGYFHNAFTFLETPISYGNQNFVFYGMEKFTIGLVNSIFLCLPTSTAHIITLRRFLMQGLEAGYLAGLGTLVGNILWIGSIVFGLRFMVIPWLSFDILRYVLGFLLLAKYMWDSYTEKRMVLEDLSKWKIFMLNFLLAFTEQATIYPFLSNLSIGSDATILESFPTNSLGEFLFIHSFYLFGLIVGSLSLLQFTCWFFENPAFNIYMWTLSSLKLTTPISQKMLNVGFLYLTMFFAVSNFSYFGLDYLVTNPLGFVHEDRLIDQKTVFETGFLNTKASDRNTRRNRGRHGRRERWKRRVRRYRTFDASLYDQGVYDLFTMEDLNYGFDRFWLRRKIRNHRVRFRFFPGPWMRSFKKQLARPRLESFMGPRVEFFRILFEQAYHPEFHEFREGSRTDNLKSKKLNQGVENLKSVEVFNNLIPKQPISFYSEKNSKMQTENLNKQYSALRKFIRKVKTRTKMAEILLTSQQINSSILESNSQKSLDKKLQNKIYSKRWKQIFSKISHNTDNSSNSKFLEKQFLSNFQTKITPKSKVSSYFKDSRSNNSLMNISKNSKDMSEKQLSKKDAQILRYKTFLGQSKNLKMNTSNFVKNDENQTYQPLTLLHPITFYLQKEKAFQQKMKFYGATLFRNFSVENNAPYYRIMMKKFFYYYKPTLRWERTMRTATMRKARRKSQRIPRKLNISKETQMLATTYSNTTNINLNSNNFDQGFENQEISNKTKMQPPTHFYSLVSKRATRYRYQIYKDVLQHWYYSPFNRLLLKFDVDSFIRRQPKSHFLTKKEENLLHLKRFLLSDYYNTLRWYSYMQHYESMKNNIGKTKSFASNFYNQQFFGTFKKIRHLFAITPSLNDSNILKFDQALFNEYEQTDKNWKNSFYNSDLIHEELLTDDQIYATKGETTLANNPQNLEEQVSTILKEYLRIATPIRQDYIRKLIQEENYTELTNFLFKGQKIRGNSPVTNNSSLLEQEKNYLLSLNNQRLEKEKLEKFFNEKLRINAKEDLTNLDSSLMNSNDLWLSLLKKSRNMLYNQEALKIYVNGRVEKLEKQKKRQEKAFKTRLGNIKNWVNLADKTNAGGRLDENNNQLSGLTTSLKKAIKEGIYFETSGSFSGKNLNKSNLRNNREKFILKELPNESTVTKRSQNLSLNLKNHLNNRVKMKAIQTLKAEEQFRKKLVSIQNIQGKFALNNLNPNLLTKIINATLVPFKGISSRLSRVVKGESNNLVFKPINGILNLLTKNQTKDLKNWKKRETVFLTRKKIRRKIYRVLDQKKSMEKISNVQDLERLNKTSKVQPTRQKQDILDSSELKRSQTSWKNYEKSKLNMSVNTTENSNWLNKTSFSEIFKKNFKRKRTRSRRYRYFKGRGPIKKHTLAEKFKRQFKLLKRYGDKTQGQDKKIEILQMITKREYDPNNFFKMRETKQRRTRQSKHRYWKKHKRQKYLQIKRKQRKRRRYSISKLRVLNKEFKRLKNQVALKTWWWQNFVPNFMTNFEASWQSEKEKQIQQELEKLSLSDILTRDKENLVNQFDRLQIGNQDFKPLSMPEALRLRDRLKAEGKLNLGEELENSEKILNKLDSKNLEEIEPIQSFNNMNKKINNEKSLMSTLSTNLFQQTGLLNNTDKNHFDNQRKMVNITPTPFYAGWDETLRQFVVTNRLLSRKEAGYSVDLSSSKVFNNNTMNFENHKKIEFTKAPLQGMNAATTLYWQIPFTTYDPDQFFALGMDGFSPLGWRFFNFKHSKQTTKPIRVNTIFSTNQNKMENQSLFSYNIQLKMLELNSQNKWGKSGVSLNSSNNRVSKNQSRKIQKRQKRVKKHPRPPVWFPSGPLTNQILPVHYIYVFYKRTRLPRDRYIGRRFRRSDDSKASFLKANLTTMFDFTLRKRVKPIRKYHRKKSLNRNKETGLIIRRRPFKELVNENIRFRPIFQTRLTNQNNFLNSSLLKSKQRKKSVKLKSTSENLRIRQLRRRIQRQVLRPIWRYKPRAGGFIWPGDYLRLEAVQAPILKDPTLDTNVKAQSVGIRKKKRRPIQEWQIQPKKYLLQKHNLKVLKKRLRNAQNFNTISEKLKQLNLGLNS